MDLEEYNKLTEEQQLAAQYNCRVKIKIEIEFIDKINAWALYSEDKGSFYAYNGMKTMEYLAEAFGKDLIVDWDEKYDRVWYQEYNPDSE